MQGIYTYIPETNNVPKEYNVAAILSLLFMAPISLVPSSALMYFYISTFRSMLCFPVQLRSTTDGTKTIRYTGHVTTQCMIYHPLYLYFK
jgi:hypothetical protein